MSEHAHRRRPRGCAGRHRRLPGAALRRRRRRPARNLWQTIGPFAVFVVFFAIIAILQPDFVGGGGLGILAIQATVLLVALGQAMVLHVGSLDLSNAALAILRGDPAGVDARAAGGGRLVVCLVIVTAVGAVNGLLVAYTQVPSFALTLGTLGIVQAASLVISGATTVYVTDNSALLAPLFGTALGGLPAAFWLAVILAACSGCCCAAPPSDRG